ncbi:hypothetical protein [Rhodoblastus sp.]|uniref:hypothetical protein n=1 Tax=Rhodoblastus sp. TaxID=1962975 RepID=UPI003F9E6CEC
MPDPDKLTPANPSDLADALAFALRIQGGKCVHNADEIKGFAPTPDAAGVSPLRQVQGHLDTVIR